MPTSIASGIAIRVASSLLLAAGLVLAGAAPQHPKRSPDLVNLNQQHKTQVIVQWNIPTGAATQAKITALSGVIVSEFKAVNCGVYLLPSAAVSQLESDPDVRYVSPDRNIHHRLDNTAAAVNASASWGGGWIGTGIGVAVVDSGINADPNLRPVAYTQDFTGLTGKDAGRDLFGHGHHVAGIIASTSATTLKASGPVQAYTRRFVGIAPGVRLLNLRVLDSQGQGSDSAVIAAIDRAITLQKSYNIRVINLSLGRPVYESYRVDPLCQAAEAAWKAGIVVVVSAGNDGRDNTYGNSGYGTINSPGNDPYVITVGAMKSEGTPSRTDDLVASYSSKGPSAIDQVVKPDLVAPGNRVVSLLASGSTLVSQNPANSVSLSYYEQTSTLLGGTRSTDFFVLSGTSMAAPVVSAAAADLIQANPKLTPDQIKTLLMRTAYKTFPASSVVTDGGLTFTNYYDIFTIGAGYLDLGAAMASIRDVPGTGTAISPSAVYDPVTGMATLSYDPTSVFGTKCLWGRESVWSATLLAADQVVWSSGSALATSSDSATKCLWGRDAVWPAGTTLGAESTGVSLRGEN